MYCKIYLAHRCYLSPLLLLGFFAIIFVFTISKIVPVSQRFSRLLNHNFSSTIWNGIEDANINFLSAFSLTKLQNRPDDLSYNYSFKTSLRRDRVIAYLIHQKRIDELSLSLESLFRHYNDRFQYSILLFHETGFQVKGAKEAIGKRIGDDRSALLEFHEIIGFSQFPPGFDIGDDVEKAKRENVPDAWRYPGYHHMCSFWFRKLLLQPRMSSVEYVMRLDSDSTIRAPITYDLFDYVHLKGIRYAYRAKLFESSCCAKYMYPLVYLYAKQNGLFSQLSPELHWMKTLKEGDLYGDRGTMNPHGHHRTFLFFLLLFFNQTPYLTVDTTYNILIFWIFYSCLFLFLFVFFCDCIHTAFRGIHASSNSIYCLFPSHTH